MKKRNRLTSSFLILAILFLCCCNTTAKQDSERPFIWAKNSERDAILKRIKDQKWAASFYQQFAVRLAPSMADYQKDKVAFLKNLPFNPESAKEGEIPPLQKLDIDKSDGKKKGEQLTIYLQIGVDCSVMYYLTQDEKYAQCALDILYTVCKGEQQLPLPVIGDNDGRVYTDHLREAREIGTQMPIIYDFIYSYIKNGAKAFDFARNTDVDFPIAEAQQLFEEIADMVVTQGMTGSNWSVLEASSMLTNVLALDDKDKRSQLLEILIAKGSKKQDPMDVIAEEYKEEGDVYPETSQYSNGVANYMLYLMTILNKYDPSLKLTEKYINIPLSLTTWDGLVYPNGDIVRFGDGKRHMKPNFQSLELSLALAKETNNTVLENKINGLFNTLLDQYTYQRSKLSKRDYGANVYKDPIPLFFYVDSIETSKAEYKLPRTFNMKHAGVFLQRNLSNTQKADDGLMCFVGGAPMVHGHASGMDMELYGEGQVLGVDHGRGSYRTEIHENYSRIFAAHNTVIVNGSSRSESGWVGLGINTVQLKTMEPMPEKEAVSPNHSFSLTTFADDKGDKAEAKQQRMLSLIRTSDTTGYYVDVFRSKSELPNEYHDYLYHNIGDELIFLNSDLQLKSTPQRYMANANDKWKRNRTYRHPGWHYFKDVQSSPAYNKDVKAQFVAKQFDRKPIYMNVHIAAADNREYTKVKAPQTFGAPNGYENQPTPTLVVRKNGEAWNNPFVAVYEPFGYSADNNTILSVEQIKKDGKFKALKITSKPTDKTIVQYIVLPSESDVFIDKESGITFDGEYAVVTLNEAGKLLNIYMGAGKKLSYGTTEITSKNGAKTAAYIDFTVQEAVVTSNDKVIVKK